MRKRTADEPLTREPHGNESEYASLGSHVASVLEAANAAAARLREEAAADAARIRNDAQRAADTKLTHASAEASKIVEEAQRQQSDAEEAAKRTTESAEAAAVRRREDADAEAAKILELAGEVATRQHSEVVARKEALDESVDLAEQRLHHLISGLRDLADRLENVLSADTPEDWNHPAGETLDEALKESVRNE
jgi:cell division septum initiation protein DivIVA